MENLSNTSLLTESLSAHDWMEVSSLLRELGEEVSLEIERDRSPLLKMNWKEVMNSDSRIYEVIEILDNSLSDSGYPDEDVEEGSGWVSWLWDITSAELNFFLGKFDGGDHFVSESTSFSDSIGDRLEKELRDTLDLVNSKLRYKREYLVTREPGAINYVVTMKPPGSAPFSKAVNALAEKFGLSRETLGANKDYTFSAYDSKDRELFWGRLRYPVSISAHDAMENPICRRLLESRFLTESAHDLMHFDDFLKSKSSGLKKAMTEVVDAWGFGFLATDRGSDDYRLIFTYPVLLKYNSVIETLTDEISDLLDTRMIEDDENAEMGEDRVYWDIKDKGLYDLLNRALDGRKLYI